MVRQGTECAVKRTRVALLGFGEDGLEALGEGLGEEGFVGPAGDEVVSECVV